METIVNKAVKGGAFLIQETLPDEIFIPEAFSEEQRMIGRTCRELLEQKVFPDLQRIDDQEPGLMQSLLNEAGNLGLLSVAVPESYGGLGETFNSSMLVTEVIGAGHSFAVALSAHTGIGTLPIVYYGNEAQKRKYLPKLASGAYKACYCLTEPGSGSDANAAKTKAVLSSDKTHYLITGQKMWITNGGFADLLIVFAKIDDDKNLSAFIVERNFGGIEMNAEEHKMGIKGSSTRQVFFSECPVPVENLLSTRESGFKIAVNILNIGRIKLAASVIGASKEVITKSVKYANERAQFGLPISKYGAIRHKLAEMATKTWAAESAAYRAGQDIDDAFDGMVAGGMDPSQAKLKSVEQFAVECAILKVHASEVLDYVVDEGVQIYGGMGFSSEAPMDRAYRDSRINRIFEGTNEINRILTVDMLLKRALKGELDLLAPAKKVADELLQLPEEVEDDGGILSMEKRFVQNLKKLTLLVAGAAVQKLMNTLAKEEEILMNLADMAGGVYIAESAVLRAQKLAKHWGGDRAELPIEMARLSVHNAVDKLYLAGKEVINAFATGDDYKGLMMGLKRFTKISPYNSKEARQKIAKSLIERNSYYATDQL